MARTANPEQLLAIEHQGGVLLRAGAGSGKTFVLVEHILYLTRCWIEAFKRAPAGTFEDFIRGKFSQVVMMTFTKKAAGEMNIRLTEQFLETAGAPGGDQAYWQIANEALPLLLVTTIDGFCKKLIALGYLPHLSTEADIIFATERNDQIGELLEEWFAERAPRIDRELLEIIVREKRDLLAAFTHVFGDPGLRLAWKKFDPAETAPASLGALLARSFALNKLDEALLAVHRLDLDEEKERSAFERLVATFQATGLPAVDAVEKLTLYADLFARMGRLDGERTARKKTPASDAAKKGLAAVRDWVAKWRDVADDYAENYEARILPWQELCLEIFRFIEDRLDPNQGMTFGDIEYFVALGLEDPRDRLRIQKAFSYFIVDEFQDTSDVQFRIIRALIGDDFRKLFCVGDAKQAIYGFRGGELSVFRDCADLVPRVLSLANNYRSLPEVIRFNNSLFRAILPLGYNFEGQDPFTVDPEDQSVPAELAATRAGEIQVLTGRLERDLERDGKFQNEELNRLEARAIADAIARERSTTDHGCTVLYSKLRPSGELLRALMERKIGFTAQFKIDLLDDPILGLFVCLLKRRFDGREETRDRYPLFLMKSYFAVLGVDPRVGEADLEAFDQNVRYWGLLEAFRKFLHALGLTNENADINLETIETIAGLYHQDPEAILTQLTRGDNQRLSLDLRSGEDAHRVQIMSAHASKGLEFDVVFLGGIYTNGREQNDGALFGNLPGSFQWYRDITRREKQKSPLYVFEAELARYKNFSEAKRLFYVACTRAKKKLAWVDLELPEKAFSVPKNSWILGLRAWLERGTGTEVVTAVPLPEAVVRGGEGENRPELPLFFHDPMGILSKGDGGSELLIAAELSVTRLNALIDCPRKFYLGNTLKVTAPDDDPASPARTFLEEEGDDLATVVRSSAERGTLLHAQIAEGIRRNFIVPRESFGGADAGPIGWALSVLGEKRGAYDFVPEEPLKFRFFSFMVSGIPDLLLVPKGDGATQVWDFKTGRIAREKLPHYWLQLACYAAALYELGKVEASESVELVLCFVDEEKLLTRTVTRDDCRSELYPLWRSQNDPWRTNPDHCDRCCYGSICPR
jgi:ATP-dependent helicase/nuclease subunit A